MEKRSLINLLLLLINATVVLSPVGNNKLPNLQRGRRGEGCFVMKIYPVQGKYLDYFDAVCSYNMLFPSLFIILLLVTVKLRLKTMRTNPKKFVFKD